MIGLGLVSYGRPEYREVVLEAIDRYCTVDHFVPVIDVAPVGVAKNMALREMLEKGCDWLFLAEDDVVPSSPLAISGYVDACEQSGCQHLMFHGHGPHNPTPVLAGSTLTMWPNYVGAWSIYSRQSLEEGGLMDEHFVNAWEHVEHTLRLAAAGFTAPWRGAADATGSENWLAEIPGSIENSSIRHTPEWLTGMQQGREYWLRTYPETYHLVFH